MTKQDIQKLALQHGFKLKLQAGGDMDLNEYVYTFAKALIAKARTVEGK